MGRAEKAVSAMEKDELGGMPPAKVGVAIANILCKSRVRPIYVIGFKYRAFVILNRILPSSFVNWVVGKLY